MQDFKNFFYKISAKRKFFLLWALCFSLLFVQNIYFWFFGFLIIFVLYIFTAPSWQEVVRDLKFLIGILFFYFLFQLFSLQLELALKNIFRLITFFLLFFLINRSIKMSEMIKIFQKILYPLKYFKIDPMPIAFTLSFIMRLVPLFIQILQEVKDAQYARGLKYNPVALFSSTIMRLIKLHDEISMALDVRCFPPALDQEEI